MCDCFYNGLEARSRWPLSRRSVLSSIACLAIVPGVILPTASKAQEDFKHLLQGSCNFDVDAVDSEVYSFKSSSEARTVIETIVSAAGLKPNFEIIAYDVPNAAAVIQNGIRYILYNPSFIDQINGTTGSKWGSWAIMAHEVGHHLNGHTLQPGGSKPPTELEADEFAGFAVQKIGGTLDQAQSPYKSMSPAGSSTHPPRDARLAAVEKGWKSAAGQGGQARIPTPTSVPAPVANARDMLKAIVTSIKSGITPPFPMVPELKSAYDAQVPGISMQLNAMGNLTELSEVKPPMKFGNATYYEYRSDFVNGQAFWRIGVQPNGVIDGLWVMKSPFP